jgi:hypothetical protein
VLSRPGQLRRPLIVSDPEALTIPDIVAAVRRGLGRRPGLIPVPAAVLRTALYAAGRSEIYERLSGSLVADPAGLRELGWSPPVANSTEDFLANWRFVALVKINDQIDPTFAFWSSGATTARQKEILQCLNLRYYLAGPGRIRPLEAEHTGDRRDAIRIRYRLLDSSLEA